MNESAHPPQPPLPPLPPSTPPRLPLPRFHRHLSSARTAPLHPQRFTSAKRPSGAVKPRAMRKPGLTGPDKARHPCTECGKCFSSLKALCGHMRCHPEREWRGINPPPDSQKPLFTDDEYQVAAALILLANGPPSAAQKIGEDSIIRSFSSSLCGMNWERRKEERKMFVRHCESAGLSFRNHPNSPSPPRHCQNRCLPDLNMPPPLESFEDERDVLLDVKQVI